MTLSPWIKYGIPALLGAIAAAYVAWLYIALGEAKKEASDALEAKYNAERNLASANVTPSVIIRYVDKIKVVEQKGKTIEKLVNVYQPTDDCKLDAQWLFIHNQATEAIPGSSSDADASSSASTKN